MLRHPPSSTRTDTLFPYTTLFLSGDEVRVLSMGGSDPARGGKPYSTELCGGTHVRRTGDIGFFKVTGEQALASGVRRIEAVVGEAARRYVEHQEIDRKSTRLNSSH